LIHTLSCRFTLSIHISLSIHTLRYRYTLSINTIDTHYRYTLSLHTIDTQYLYTSELSIHTLDTYLYINLYSELSIHTIDTHSELSIHTLSNRYTLSIHISLSIHTHYLVIDTRSDEFTLFRIFSISWETPLSENVPRFRRRGSSNIHRPYQKFSSAPNHEKAFYTYPQQPQVIKIMIEFCYSIN
jgi:hypothetical protein